MRFRQRASSVRFAIIRTHIRTVRRPFVLVKDMDTRRSDRTPGNRAAFDKARRVILSTQDVCGICGKPVDKTLKYPHPLSPTVDHIIPVSKGGHPSDLANLQLAHRCCNRAKSDKLVEKKSIVPDKVLSNRLLPLHADWMGYRAQ